VAVVQQVQQVQELVAQVVLVIYTLVELVQREQEQVLAVAAVERDLLALAQTHLLTMAVLAAQAAAVVVGLALVVLQVQAAMELFIFTTKE
jgi:hypothetical protein